ncbi:MAG: cation-transporting P-type ATPase [Chloroflexota bacterium]|nr:MAG: cation-transporting P-type ATPase [Chloroflexota bacterium]
MLDIYALSAAEVYRELKTSPRGLDPEEAARRLSEHGPNEIREVRRAPLVMRFLANLYQIFAILLWISAALAFLSGSSELAWAIIFVIFVNAIFSFSQEYQAEKAVEALKQILPARAKVYRGGEQQQILARELVPGDVMSLEEGDLISADARLVESFQLRTNNAALTGESEPVSRTTDPLQAGKYALIEATNLVFAGTSVAYGSGRAVVFATGMQTQFGNIAGLTQGVKEEPSPLTREVNRVALLIAGVAVCAGILFFGVGTLVAGLSLRDSLVFAIGMITANVPEGLLPTLTLALAVAVRILARRHAIVKRLTSVETLGSTSVICTDKTGTLTQNQMTVREVWVDDRVLDVTGVGYRPMGDFVADDHPVSTTQAPELPLLLRAAAFCNNSRLIPPKEPTQDWGIVGDPTEAALLVAAQKGGLDRASALQAEPRIYELPFDSQRKRMTTIHQQGNQRVAYVKGAPREVLELCTTILLAGQEHPLDDELRSRIMEQNDAFAGAALRVLAAAYRRLPSDLDFHSTPDVETKLTLLGLMAMQDPPRPEVAGAVELCHKAGIRVIMITGDYGLTAISIARRIGLVQDRARIVTGMELDRMSEEELGRVLDAGDVLFARVAPEHKMRIAAALQARRNIVAMTGDGVNDAPALKKADIGVAMGIAGTDVAKESAQIILTDDNFATIVSAVEEGRVVYDNIRKFCVYIFAHLGPEAVPFIFFALFPVPLAITAMQILAIDLGTETLPALALGLERPEPGVMSRPPRKSTQRLIDTPLLVRAYLFFGAIESVLVMAGFFLVLYLGGWSWGIPLAGNDPLYLRASTVAFLGIVATQVGTVFAARTQHVSVFTVGLFSNRWVVYGIVFELLITLALVYLPPLQALFGTTGVGWPEWLLVATFGPIILAADELRKWGVRRTEAT